MLGTLRARLLASYVAILLILLLLVGLVLLAFLAARPVSTDTVVGELTATLLDIRLTEGLWVGGGGMGPGGMQGGANLTLGERVLQALSTEAEQRGARILLVSGDGEVQFDSAGVVSRGTSVPDLNFAPLITPRGARITAVFEGQADLANQGKWVFVAQPLRPMAEASAPNQYFLMVAAPLPRHTLQEIFDTFGETFFVPLAEAGAIGLVIALGLSVLIAGSVARPLQSMGRAARRIADGDYRQRVPVKGPREVRALAAAFNDMAARVAASQQAQRDFLANVSHDLRTPLTSIQGFSQAIDEGVAADPESSKRAARIIHDEAARMNRMVESLLDLARIEASQVDVPREPVGLGTLLRHVVDSFAVRASDRGVALQLDTPPALPPVMGDGDRLAQVFTNLIDNAIEHTPPGGAIRLQAQPARQGIAVSVRDTGEGIPADDLPRVFERFYRVDKSRQRIRRSGAGLGLAIAKQIVEAHGGTIEVSSEEGRGTTVTVWLPQPTTS